MDTVKLWIERLRLTSVSPSLPKMQLAPDAKAQNPVMIQFFTWEAQHADMSWWKHFETEMPRLAELGFTQVWLPPPNKAMHKQGQGYDAYDLWDIGEFDQKGTVSTRWGTKEELLQACSAARQRNIGVLIDAVLNHKLGADRLEVFSAVPVDPKNRVRALEGEREIKGWTAFDFPGRQGRHSQMQWTQEHFSGLGHDELTQTGGVYRISSSGHRGWSTEVDKEFGNYDYLLGIDIDHRHPEVRHDLFSWGSWILEETGASGFRLDAIKHIDRSFLLEFIQRSRNLPNRERLLIVSECWSTTIQKILPYVRAFQGQTAFFDVPLHGKFHQASKQGQSYDLRHIFDNTLVAIRPEDAVTFVDNHDTQVGQSLESWVDTNFKIQAYALILLRCDGFPCVFYGDLYPNEECFDQETAAKLGQLLTIRQMFAHGAMKDYFEHRNCIGFVRMGDAGYPGCVVVISNEDGPPDSVSPTIRINVGLNGKKAVFHSAFDASREITTDGGGWGEFYCPRNSVDVWIKAQQA
ncbi:glycoside hydrolase family 13 protein [Paxillus rubicundulus Ve08.2h10]|uniref:Glycoside hydrolase family 13 protein n=1 Tax=Paxillus rubicundulus Ve08.2h10 TaxID=930991 RepID=A0A0D0DIV8_9AGAM|nr:glycoside hydrolase family 13 protein [Paxillus rubicundulus Ve08.2h10]